MKNMKKLFALLMVAAMMFSLAACGTEEEEEEETSVDVDPVVEDEDVWTWEGMSYDDIVANGYKAENIDVSGADGVLAEILAEGKLTIATSPDYPPMEGVDELTGEVKGAEILVAQYIADSLGVELVVETMDFDAVLTAVDTGKVDLGISGFGYKADRAEAYELSEGYSTGSAADHHTLLVAAADLDKFNSLEDFNTDIVIDAQSSSLQEMYVTDQLPNATKQLVTDLGQAVMDIAAGKVDAVAMDSTTAKAYADQSDGQFVSVYAAKGIEFDLSMYGDVTGNVMAAKKGETSLINAVNAILDQLLTEEVDGYKLYSNFYYASCELFGIDGSEEE